MTHKYLADTVSTANENLGLLDLIRVIVDNLKLLILVPLLIGAMVTALVYFFVAPTYTSTVKFIAPQQPQSLGAGALSALGLQGLGGGIGAALRNPSEIYLAFMTSNRMLDVIINKFKLMDQFPGLNRDDLRISVVNKTKIILSKEGIISASVTDGNAQRAADIANQYPMLLQEMITEYAVAEATLRRKYLSQQVDQLRQKVVRQEMELKQTGVSADMLKLDMNASVSEIANLKAAITAQEIRIRSLATYLTPNAPEYRLAQGELSSLVAQLRKVENAHTREQIGSKYPERYRNYLYDLQLLESLIKQAELAQIDADKEEVLVQVMDAAEPPSRKTGPSYRNTLMVSTVITGFFLLIWVYLQFAVQRVRTHHDPTVKEKFYLLAQSWHSVWRLR